MARPHVKRSGKLKVGSARCRPLNVGPLFAYDMETFDVIWRGETVGRLTEARIDMYFLDGKFTAAPSAVGQDFASRASKLDPKIVVRDYTKGIRVEVVSSADETAQKWPVVITMLDGLDLGLYWPSSKDGSAWVVANVPEIPADNQPLQQTGVAAERSWFQRLFGRGSGR
jgi:hypothetical protein